MGSPEQCAGAHGEVLGMMLTSAEACNRNFFQIRLILKRERREEKSREGRRKEGKERKGERRVLKYLQKSPSQTELLRT